MPMTPHQEQMLNELHIAIVGNKNMRQKGVIERVEILEKHKEKTTIRQATQTGIFTSIGIGLAEFGRWIIGNSHG